MEIVKSDIYVCSRCGKEFLDIAEASNHEAECKEGTPYRVVILRPRVVLNPEFVSEIRYMPEGAVEDTEAGTVFHRTTDSYEIYTFDLSEKEELRCKQMVLEEAIRVEKEAIIKHKAVLKPFQRMLDKVYKRISEVEDESDHGA